MLKPPRRLSWRERFAGVLEPSRPSPRSGFLRDLVSPFFFGWQPVLREPLDEYRRAQYEVVRRAVDAICNSGWLSGGIEQATTMIVGPALTLNARADATCFGGDTKAAADWSRDVERRFNAWARSAYACDLVGRQNLSQMCSQAIRSWFAYGEILAIVRYKLNPGNSHGTKMQALPPSRCPQAARNPDAVQGVILDRDGLPIRYCIWNYDWQQPGLEEEIEVMARDETGRGVVVHIHDSPATVVRGLSPLTPALQVVRQFDQLSNATLTAALIQALFAATIESDAPTDQLLAAMQDTDEQDTETVVAPGALDLLMKAKAEWYENTKVDLGNAGKLLHLFVGEKLNFLRSEHPNDNYKPFAKMLLLEIARCLGISYEMLTGDREGSTYSSERMGTAENWPLMEYRRVNIAGRFMQSAYESWLEEDIELGNTIFPNGLPAFQAQRALACASDWRGPPKPSADDYKTAKANEVLLTNKIITREQWCAEQGTDYDDVFEQIAQEDDRASELGIDLVPPKQQQSYGGGKAPSEASPSQDETAPAEEPA